MDIRKSAALWMLLTAIIMLGLASASTDADETGESWPRAAVFNLLDDGNYPDRLIGRRAADAVFVALIEEAPWELVSRTRLQRLCEAEAARAPFAIAYLQMLGHRVRAPLALTGVVEVCEVNKGRGTAQVTLLVELLETLEGATLASKRGVGSARRSDDEVAPIDQIVDRALSDAARDAVRKLTTFHQGTAMVAATLPDGRVMLDGPDEPALEVGSKLLVYRGADPRREMIGALEVKESRLTVIHAQPLAGEEFRQGDRAVVVAR